MANYAHVENEKIVNVVVAENDYAIENGLILIPENSGIGIGWDYVNGEFQDKRETTSLS